MTFPRTAKNRSPSQTLLALLVLLMLGCLTSTLAHAFDSGSTGVDGAFNPTVDTELPLPPDGIFNFTTVDIPAGVTVTFTPNATNTPVIMLATGDVTINGTIDVSGKPSPGVGSAGNGDPGDDGDPGLAGPGGFDGGQGGTLENQMGGDGLGPGAGIRSIGRQRAVASGSTTVGCGGGGAGFGSGGSNADRTIAGTSNTCTTSTGAVIGGTGGPTYGNIQLSPLIGGSGGGGGYAGVALNGSGGGGGGGAIVIASSGTVTINGVIRANGGDSGSTSGAGTANYGGTGGGGSGGAIRIIATTIAGNGTISATGGAAGTVTNGTQGRGGSGGLGRIRLEAEVLTRTAATNPPFTTGAPQPVFVSGMPSLRITTVAGIATPAAPTGNADVTVPDTTANPVTVEFETIGVPTGNTITLKVIPASGAPATVTSTALVGTTTLATANASANLPNGSSVLQASVSYTVTASLGDTLSRFAQGERVESVTLTAGLQGEGQTVFTTVSGKTHAWPNRAVAMY